MVYTLEHRVRIWESIGPSRSLNVLSMKACARGVHRVSVTTTWSYQSFKSLTQQKLGRSQQRRKLSMPDTIVIKRSMSSFPGVFNNSIIS